MAKATTERVAVWLTPDQVAWLKTKENVSSTLRALVNEAMNMHRLADSLKQKQARKAGSEKLALVKAGKAKAPVKVAKEKAPVKGGRKK
jgi:peroxiredoxin family protein